ncbi:type II CAAX endopeptidase family protein [Quadrisphaera sp. INWT6]|uniref:type II CAAX endopeptidase family protein n=1 Tax=Quadrisphaera sp. INWT6 TaxID=2596917 RepID=UPI0019D5F146|nr:type II CAAX endopeptidase family protein [Quadrisphaera sp. INWT6]
MSTTTAAAPPDPARPGGALRLVPSVLLVVAGVLVFALEQRPAGWAVLAAALVAALVLGRRERSSLGRDHALAVLGTAVMSLVPVTTDISWAHMTSMGAAMVVAVGAPYALSRWAFRDHAIRFPVATGRRWSRFEWWWLAAVVVLGWTALPFYLVTSGVYENWPAARTGGELFRLFLGTNALGIWDELFFICTVFTLLRRHHPVWLANLLQAVLFTAFLYELGFREWGPLLVFPFALIQGFTFATTRSLSYVVAVHLTFDAILFMVLVHAHTREWFPLFLY